MEMLSDGACTFRSELDIAGDGSAPFVVGAGWLVEIIEPEAGEFYFVSGGTEVRPSSRRFGVYYAQFSIVDAVVRDLKAIAFGIGSFQVEEPALPARSFVFDTDFAGPFTSSRHAADVLSNARNLSVIDINPNPSLLSIKAKRLIDDNYRAFPSIARIAARLNVSHEHLTRQFKRDYKLTPGNYLHRVRAAEASYKLQLGEEIIEVSADVGYNDLSRFYKQFRKEMKASPGSCRT